MKEMKLPDRTSPELCLPKNKNTGCRIYNVDFIIMIIIICHLLTVFLCPPLADLSFLPAPVSWWGAHGEYLQAVAAFERSAGAILCLSRASGESSATDGVSAGVECTLDKRKQITASHDGCAMLVLYEKIEHCRVSYVCTIYRKPSFFIRHLKTT